MHLTQPTVSHTLAKLRTLLGDPLFTRTRHGLIPTSRALALEPELRRIFSSVESILAPEVFDKATCDATVVISSNDYMQYVLLAPVMREIRRQAPNMRVAIRQAEIVDLVPMLDNGQIDMAVTIPEFADKRLRSRHLYDESYVVAMRKSHHIHRETLSMDEFLSVDHAIVSPTEAQFHGPTDDALRRLGLSRQVAFSVSSFFTLIELISNSDVVALIPERLAKKFTDVLSFSQPPVPVSGFEAIMVWNNKTHLDPVREWVREQIGNAVETV